MVTPGIFDVVPSQGRGWLGLLVAHVGQSLPLVAACSVRQSGEGMIPRQRTFTAPSDCGARRPPSLAGLVMPEAIFSEFGQHRAADALDVHAGGLRYRAVLLHRHVVKEEGHLDGRIALAAEHETGDRK